MEKPESQNFVSHEVIGKKFDAGKTRYDLAPPFADEEVNKVLTHGSVKYADNNWIHVEPGFKRYYAAARRHMAAWKQGESHDPETGLHHLAHAVVNLLFLMEKDMFKDKLVEIYETKVR